MTVAVIRGDARDLPLPDQCVDLIVTSPPYWSLRDYRDGGQSMRGQIGSEPTHDEYVDALIECTREWVRVLKPAGSMFINLGDKYSGAQQQTHGRQSAETSSAHWRRTNPTRTGIPGKSLMGLPWRYALGCIDQLGLILREEIIWSKTNGMPESVTDRARRSHEQLFHLTSQPRYYSAADEIREPASGYERAGSRRRTPHGQRPRTMTDSCNPLGRLPGSVWEIGTQALKVPDPLAHARCCDGRKANGCEDGLGHYAAFPMELPRRVILGWSPPGICTACGEGRRPVVTGGRVGDGAKPRKAALRVSSFDWAAWKESKPHQITGYSCACPRPDAPTRAAVVLDPFGGTGTAALLASALGRTGISVDRSADYCRIAAWRTTDPGERARAMQVAKPPPRLDGQISLFDVAASP